MAKKYTKIHFVRHAQSTSNLEDRLSGGGDNVSLTELGKKQASDRGSALVEYKENISYIVHSDMIRTFQTATIINGWLNLEMRSDPDLKEKRFGKLEGLKGSEVRELIDKSAKHKNLVIAEHGGEAEDAFIERVTTTFCNYFNSGEEEIVMVSHGIYGRKAHEIFFGRSHNFQNAEHVIFDPALIDVAGKCGFEGADL